MIYYALAKNFRNLLFTLTWVILTFVIIYFGAVHSTSAAQVVNRSHKKLITSLRLEIIFKIVLKDNLLQIVNSG